MAIIITVLVLCICFIIFGLALGAIAFGVCSIGTLVMLGFEAAYYLMPVLIVIALARLIWKMTTTKKKVEKETKETEE